LSEKSFAIADHPKLSSLVVDFLEFEPEFLLLGGKIPVDVLFFFSLLSTKAPKPAEPIVSALSLFGFHNLDSVGVDSGLSVMASWTISRSSESRPSEILPNRGARGLPLVDRVIMTSILSMLSSSLGVGREEKLEAVIVGDRAGRLDLFISECTLDLFSDLPRLTSSAFSLASLVEVLMAIGGGRLFSRRDGGNSDKSADEEKGESGRGMTRGSKIFTEGIGGSDCTVYRSTGGSGQRKTR